MERQTNRYFLNEKKQINIKERKRKKGIKERNTYKHTYIHTYTHTNMHSYKRTYIDTHIH